MGRLAPPAARLVIGCLSGLVLDLLHRYSADVILCRVIHLENRISLLT
jgi:hypothetical protein